MYFWRCWESKQRQEVRSKKKEVRRHKGRRQKAEVRGKTQEVRRKKAEGRGKKKNKPPSHGPSPARGEGS